MLKSLVYSFIIGNAKRFVRVENARPSQVVSALRQAGADSIGIMSNVEFDRMPIDWRAHDNAVRFEAQYIEPQDIQTARAKQHNAIELDVESEFKALFG